jgi:hypothetical protein
MHRHYCDFHVTAGVKKAKKRDAEALQSILSTQRMALQGSYIPLDGGSKSNTHHAGPPASRPASQLQLNQIKNELRFGNRLGPVVSQLTQQRRVDSSLPDRRCHGAALVQRREHRAAQQPLPVQEPSAGT